MLISILCLVYNEADAIPLFFEALSRETSKADHSFELLFINDGSTDSTLAEIQNLRDQETDIDVRVIDFSRNLGKSTICRYRLCKR